MLTGLHQWSPCLILQHFNTVLHVQLTLNHKIIFLQFYDCNFPSYKSQYKCLVYRISDVTQRGYDPTGWEPLIYRVPWKNYFLIYQPTLSMKMVCFLKFRSLKRFFKCSFIFIFLQHSVWLCSCSHTDLMIWIVTDALTNYPSICYWLSTG